MCGGASILMTYYEKEIQYLEINDDSDDADDSDRAVGDNDSDDR